MKPPEVTPHRIDPNPSYPGHVLVRIVCPYCGREHTHGAPEGETPGHRAASCHHAGGYFIRGAAA